MRLTLRSVACAQTGFLVFRTVIIPRSFARLDISADFDDDIPEPDTGGMVSQELKTILGFTDEWAKNPDYQRARACQPQRPKYVTARDKTRFQGRLGLVF